MVLGLLLAWANPQLWIFLATVALSIALAVSQKKPSVRLDDKLQSSATRGSFIPLVIGRYRIGPVFAFVNDATNTFSGDSLTPGFGKGSGEPGPAASYHENALHLLCVGPGSRLVAIYENGEALWRGPITPATHPSGTQIQVSAGSFFKIYWGFEDDPEIDLLAAAPEHGLAVRYALCMKVLWIPKNLGGGRTWPRLEYEIECPCYSKIAQTASELPLEADDAHPTLGEMGAELENWQTENTRALLFIHQFQKDPVTGQVQIRMQDPWQAHFPNASKYRWAVRQGSIIKVSARSLSLVGNTDPVLASPYPNKTNAAAAGFTATNQWYFFWVKDSFVDPTPLKASGGTTSNQDLVVVLGPQVTGYLIANLDPSVYALTSPIQSMYVLGEIRPIDSEGTDGVNLIHMIDQLLFAAKPYGAGRDRSLFDERSIEAAARTVELEGLRCCVCVQNGEGVESVLAGLMQDAGLFISWDPQIGKFVFLLQRYEEPENCAELPGDMILKQPEMISSQGPRSVDTLAFSYKDRRRNYREETLVQIDNGQVTLYETQKAKKATIECTTDGGTAVKLVPRRQQEALANLSVVTFETNHAAKMALAGKLIKAPSVEDSDLLFRITSVQRDINSGKVVLETVVDAYDPAPSVPELMSLTDSPTAGGTTPPSSGVAALALTGAFELPRLFGTDKIRVVFPSARGSIRTGGGVVWGSRTGSSYAVIGDATIAAAGELVDPLPEDGPCYDLGTYEVTPIGVDFDTLQDLSVSPDSWRAGQQVMLIGDEVIFLRNTYGDALQGLLRGRAGTRVQAHPSGTKFFVAPFQLLQEVSGHLFAPQRTVSYKTVPWQDSRFGDVSTVEATSFEVTGKAFTPLAPTGLRQTNMRRGYDTSGDLEIVWGWHSPTFPQTGLGTQAFGAVCGVSPPRGSFTARIINNVGAVVLESILPGPALALDSATRAEIGIDSLPFWTLEVVAIEGSFTSAPGSLTLTPE